MQNGTAINLEDRGCACGTKSDGCIRTGEMVWKHEGYPCGPYTDIIIAREAYVLSVDVGEKTLADNGYRDQTFFILPNCNNKDTHGRIMARHETVNKRMKQFQA